MLIAHLSDLHAVPESGAARGGFDVDAALHKAFQALHALDPRPDLIVVSGDVAEEGEAEAYARTAERLRALKRSLVVVRETTTTKRSSHASSRG